MKQRKKDLTHKGRAEALGEDFLDSDKATSGLSVARRGLPSQSSPSRWRAAWDSGRCRGVGRALQGWKRGRAGGLRGANSYSGDSPQ